MRPITQGSTTSYDPTAIFTTPIQDLVRKFSVIRYMDWTSTNWSQQVNWTDRTYPDRASYNYDIYLNNYGWQGRGGPWEYVVLFSNVTGTDPWINIPVNATDAYITNVANLFKYGSNGITPYSSTQASPVYPPLRTGLHVYVEYSNELWYGAFSQQQANCTNAQNDLTTLGNNAPINWDHIYPTTASTDLKFCSRKIAERIVNISNLWRAVWGDTEMGTTVRPVLSTQYTASGGQLFHSADMLLNYYNHLQGGITTPTQPAARPPNYYIYGAGGAPYYKPQTINTSTNTPGTSAAVSSNPYMVAATSPHPGNMLDDTKWTTALGVMHTAYEGGPEFIKTNNTTIDGAYYDAAFTDHSSVPNLTTDIVNLHNAWSNNGGGLWMYYSSSGDFTFSFTNMVTNLATPKMEAINTLNLATPAPITVGTAIPGSTLGSTSVSCSRPNGQSYSCGNNDYGVSGSKMIWANYMFNATTAASRTVTLTFTSATAAQVAVYVDGVKIGGTQSTSGSTLVYSAGNIGVGLHGVIVNAVAGTFAINTIAVN
jgi:hypothetical protein